jgi:hypothetical protein
VGFALGQIIYGPLLDRFGRKQPLYVGLSIYIVCSIGCVEREIHFRDAWSIGPNDPDGIAVHDDDDPIVPSHVVDPPYKELLKWKKRGFDTKK